MKYPTDGQVEKFVESLLRDPEGNGMDNVTRALQVIDTICSLRPAAIDYYAGGLVDEAWEYLGPDWPNDDYANDCAILASSIHLLLTSMAQNVREGLGISPEAKKRFDEGAP